MSIPPVMMCARIPLRTQPVFAGSQLVPPLDRSLTRTVSRGEVKNNLVFLLPLGGSRVNPVLVGIKRGAALVHVEVIPLPEHPNMFGAANRVSHSANLSTSFSFSQT